MRIFRRCPWVMTAACVAIAAGWSVFGPLPSACAVDPALLLEFLGPTGFTAPPGAAIGAERLCLLSSSETLGPLEAWSIAVVSERARIARISLEGADAAAALGRGFERSELTTGPGNEGAVTAVVLPVKSPATLASGQPFSLASLWVEGSVPESGPTRCST